MADVAGRAGVSYQTVSRVLNEPELVRPDTRARVLEAISELGYTRNRAARALKTTRSSLIGILTDGSALFGPAETTTAIEQAAREADYALLLTTAGPGDDTDSEVGTQLIGSGADGILVVAAHEGMIAPVEAVARHTPVVAVSAQPLGVPGVQEVGVDQALGSHLVVEHLARTGCRSVVHLAGPADWFDARARREGFEKALSELSLDGSVLGPGDWTPRSGYELGRRLIREGLPDAIFAANDMMAIGVAHALHQHGLHIPDDVALVGFDNTMGAEFLIPSLTTVSQPFAELGRTALQLLVQGVEAPSETTHPADSEPGILLTVPPRLVVRRSTRPERTH